MLMAYYSAISNFTMAINKYNENIMLLFVLPSFRQNFESRRDEISNVEFPLPKVSNFRIPTKR